MLDSALKWGGILAAGATLAGFAQAAPGESAKAPALSDVRVEISFEPQRESYPAGEPFWYVIRISWKGGTENPLDAPPREPVLQNLNLLAVSTSNVIMPETGEAAEEYRYKLCGEKEGPACIGTTDFCLRKRPTDAGAASRTAARAMPHMLLDAAEAAENSGDNGGLTAVSSASPSHRAMPVANAGNTISAARTQLQIAAPKRNWTPAIQIGAGAAGALALMGFAGFAVARRRRAMAAEPAKMDPWQTLRARTEAMDRSLVEGDYETFYGEIRDILSGALALAGLWKGATPSAAEFEAWRAAGDADVQRLGAGVAGILESCENVRFGAARPDAAAARETRTRMWQIVERLQAARETTGDGAGPTR